ncbi:MAG: glycosyltransferase family 4 protein [Phycisphaerae bacterium]|nr:glycosyltransferase family 4 protein [Phycisphaerae bacterium]
MRILHIDKFLPGWGYGGGVEACIGAMVGTQQAAGHTVMEFGTVRGGDEPEMPRFFDFTASKSPLNLPRMIHNAEAADKLEKLLKRCRVDVAHIHSIYHHLTPSILPVLARRHIGIVMQMHDYRMACPAKHFLRPRDGVHCMRCQPNKYFHAAGRGCSGLAGAGPAVESYVSRLTRNYFRWVDFFICPTRFMRRIMRNIGAPRSKLIVLRNMVSTPAKPKKNKEKPRQVLFAGRMSPEKAPEMMLDLAARVDDIDVVMAGDGPMLDELKCDASDRGLDNITFTGHISCDEVGALMHSSAAVIVTSRWLENSTMTMLEAMLAGRCVIVPDRGPLREWIDDERTGRLFKPDDIDSLVTVTQQVLSNAAARRRMGRAGKELASARHDHALIADRLEILYTEAAARCALRW